MRLCLPTVNNVCALCHCHGKLIIFALRIICLLVIVDTRKALGKTFRFIRTTARPILRSLRLAQINILTAYLRNNGPIHVSFVFIFITERAVTRWNLVHVTEIKVVQSILIWKSIIVSFSRTLPKPSSSKHVYILFIKYHEMLYQRWWHRFFRNCKSIVL